MTLRQRVSHSYSRGRFVQRNSFQGNFIHAMKFAMQLILPFVITNLKIKEVSSSKSNSIIMLIVVYIEIEMPLACHLIKTNFKCD